MTGLDRTMPVQPLRGDFLHSFGLIGWRWISRNPAAAVAPVLVPFVFLYFLRIVTPSSYFPGEVVGAMLFTTQNIGNWTLGDSATWRIENGLQDLFVASPLGKFRYLMGIAFSNLIAAAPALLVLAGVLAYVTPVAPVDWLILTVTILVLWILFASIGIAISSRLRTRREVWPIGQLTFTTLGMLSPLYYPLSVLPAIWRSVAFFFPGTYAALWVKGSLGLEGPVLPLPVDAGLLGVSAVVAILIAQYFYRWGTGD